MVGILGFRKNPRYLLWNNGIRIAAAAAVNFVIFQSTATSLPMLLLYLVPMIFLSTAGILTSGFGLLTGLALYHHQNGFELYHLAFAAAALLVTFPVTSLYHACAHEAVRPRWLNRLLGEICGLIHTSSLDEWSVIHSYHHRYADDPARDPHCPRGKSFVHFASTTGKEIKESFVSHYFEAHPESEASRANLQATMTSMFVRQQLLTLFWFLALGPAAFLYFFGVNIVLKKVHYAWFNWATHVQRESKPEIINQNRGVYWLVNLISFNLYFHKNHHLHPAVFNPKNIPADAAPESRDAA